MCQKGYEKESPAKIVTCLFSIFPHFTAETFLDQSGVPKTFAFNFEPCVHLGNVANEEKILVVGRNHQVVGAKADENASESGENSACG